MAIGSGIAGQLGVKAEVTYGTPLTVDRFFEFNSESLVTDKRAVVSHGIGNGRFFRHDRRKHYIAGGSGQVELDVMNKDFGLLFQHMLGQNTVSGAGANKTHTCIPDALALQGKSLTVQVGRPDVGGTVRPFTYEGGKITAWEFRCAIDEVLKLVLDFDFENMLDVTALATATYTATREAFVFTEGALTIGGSAVPVRSASIKGENMLKTDRRFLGNTKKEPLANGIATIGGTLEAEFESLTRFDAFLAGTQAQLILTFTTATVIPTTAVPYSLTITIPKIEYAGGEPAVGGPDVLMTSLPFVGLYDGTNPIVTVALVTADTVP